MVSPFPGLHACLHSPNCVRASSHVYFYRRHSSYANEVSSRDFALVSILDRPAMSSGASNIANRSITRGVYGSQPVVTSHYSAFRFNTAGQEYTCTAASTGLANVWCPQPAPLPTSENLLAMIATTIEKINADGGLPAMQVLKFDGSPKNYPVFRKRFHQMVDSKALDEPTKMARLIQFLEGPALLAVCAVSCLES